MTINQVDVKTVAGWLDSNQAILIDVREPAEYIACYIAAAKLHPLSQLDAKQLPVDTNKKIVIHCRSGKRSLSACQKLIKKHPDLDFYNMEGGILEWQSKGLATTVSVKHKVLPLDRQVQLTIGCLLILASLLSYFISPLFIAITAAIGCGLVLAGATGTCGLAMLLAKMPWNQKVNHELSNASIGS